jgi:outer membrane protein W
MKTRILGSVLVMALMAALPALASSSDLGVFLAFTKPQDAANAWGGGVTSRIRFIELRSTYFESLTASQSKFTCPPFCANGKPKLHYGTIEAGLFYKFNNDENLEHHVFQPYLGAGGGFYLFRQINSTYGSFNNQLGWYGEAGTEINMSGRWGFMVEANYRHVSGTLKGVGLDHPSVTVTREQLQLGGPGVNAGFVWHFF